MTEEQMDRYLLSVTEKIMEFGWIVQGVFGKEPDATGRLASFSYTVGLSEGQLPELFLDTMKPTQATPILNAIARQLKDGLVLRAGGSVDINYNITFRMHGPIDPGVAEANMARNLYGKIELWQVLWPDTAGLFPDDPGYDETNFPQRLMALA